MTKEYCTYIDFKADPNCRRRIYIKYVQLEMKIRSIYCPNLKEIQINIQGTVMFVNKYCQTMHICGLVKRLEHWFTAYKHAYRIFLLY